MKTPAHTIYIQSLKASVGMSRVVDITPVWYSLIMKSLRLVRLNIVTWCCYYNSHSQYVRSQASSSSFSRTIPQPTQHLGINFLFCNFARCQLICKILPKQTQQQICYKEMVKRPTISKSHCYSMLWLTSIIINIFNVVAVFLTWIFYKAWWDVSV